MSELEMMGPINIALYAVDFNSTSPNRNSEETKKKRRNENRVDGRRLLPERRIAGERETMEME